MKATVILALILSGQPGGTEALSVAQYSPPHRIRTYKKGLSEEELVVEEPLANFKDKDGAETSVWMALSGDTLLVHFRCGG